MNILVLEDNLERIRQFKKKFINHSLTVVMKASEAIELLQDQSWDELYLDHDLGDQIMQPSGPGTGYEVAVWLSEHPERKPTRMVLHSFNPVGLENMSRALPEAVVNPGAWEAENTR